jgi:hypothetical protein
MTHDLKHDLAMKPVLDEDQNQYLYVIFKAGNLQEPLLILHGVNIIELWRAYNKVNEEHAKRKS